MQLGIIILIIGIAVMLYAIHCESVKNEKQRLEEENQRIKEEETLIRINSTSPSKMTEEDIECLIKIFRKLGRYHPEYEKERSKLINTVRLQHFHLITLR
jgi:DNA-binding sugar fermentation-stimulating protein